MYRKPILQVMRGGIDIMSGLAGVWLEARVTDQAGTESDSATLVCLGPPRRFAIPKRGEEVAILMGWRDEGAVLQGIFSFQKARASGDPHKGDLVHLEFRAANFVDKLKAYGSEHYDEETFGARFQKLAKAAGLSGVVDPALAGIKLSYGVRWDQSPIDYLNELAEEIGGTVKPAGGKLVAMKRGAGTSGGGAALTPILIQRSRVYAYDVEVEPRPEYGTVVASWHDEKAGRRKLEKVKTGVEGPYRMLPHPFRTKEDAKKAAEADAYEAGHHGGGGTFECPGLPHARAEAPVIVTGFGAPLDGAWKAETVEKVVTKAEGFTTTVTVKAGNEKKGSKGK